MGHINSKLKWDSLMAEINFVFRNSKYILNVCDCFIFCQPTFVDIALLKSLVPKSYFT